MGPYSDKAGDLGLYPKITLSVSHSACLLAQGFIFIKIKNLWYKQFGTVFSPKISKSSWSYTRNKQSFPQKTPNISGK